MSYIAVIPSREPRGELYRKTVESLRNQTVEPSHIYVCKHDSSLWEQFDHEECLNLDLPFVQSFTRVPRLINLALPLRKRNEHLFISGDDSIYEKDYAATLISSLDRRTAIISGNKIENGIKNHAQAPEGSGRILTNWFMNLVPKFPTSIIWESWLLLEAQRRGFRNSIVQDATFQHLRPLASNSIRTFGHSSYMLGYPMLYMMMRTLLAIGKTRKLEMLGMLQGQVEATLLNFPRSEISDYTRRMALERMLPNWMISKTY